MKKIYLFPDTNVFVQCKALEELDWSRWGAYEEVSLLVTRPVQAEIDRQKGSGNGRLSARARRASGLFRKILQSDQKCLEVRSKNPVVRLYLRQDLKRDESLADQLSFDERDDQLVGTVALFSKHNPLEDVLLLTHDTGPMATAQMVEVPYWPIPDSWLLPPEKDEKEKRIEALQMEITSLRNAEPKITSRVISGSMDSLKDLGVKIYTPLTDEEIKGLIQKIKEKITVETAFNSKKPSSRLSDHLLGTYCVEREFASCSESEIKNYRDVIYPKWLDACAKILHNLHHNLNYGIHWPDAVVFLSNVGTRPAEDVYVIFSAKGNFQIMPPRHISAEDESKPVVEVKFPKPPFAPRGRWQEMPPGMDYLDSSVGTVFVAKETVPFRLPPECDPNRFYYRERSPQPVDSFDLSCSQWRHQDDDEEFEMTLHVETSPATYAGSLEIKVKASNMANPFIVDLPVRITVTEASALDTAERLVDKFLGIRT